MKKNVMMRLACFLLVAVLISTSAISGTYAKYVTKGEGEDSARVAKWGVTISTTGDMFADSYKNVKTDYEAGEEKAEITVQAEAPGTDVIAPGTEGTLASFAVTGTPEVDVEVTYVADLALSGWEVDSEVYCPIIFTINGVVINGADYTDIAALVADVEEAIAKEAKAYYHTNTDLSAVNDDLTVSWKWPFSTGDANDEKDTDLGDKAVADDITISLAITCTITQVD